MRGVVSAGMLSALETLGYGDCFDAIYACSSGAINAAYFLGGNTWYPLRIYVEDLTTGEFLNFRRPLFGRGPMDLDYVFEKVLTEIKPLDYGAAIADPRRLHVMITDVDRMLPIAPSDWQSPDDLKSGLRASSWLPMATRGTSEFRGTRAIDGGILEFHPSRVARRSGHSHVLSLSTRPIAPPRWNLSITNRFAARNIETLRRGLGDGYRRSTLEYIREDRPLLAAARRSSETQQLNVLDIAPTAHELEVARHEMSARILEEGAASGVRAIYLALERRQVEVSWKITVRGGFELTKDSGV